MRVGLRFALPGELLRKRLRANIRPPGRLGYEHEFAIGGYRPQTNRTARAAGEGETWLT